ncbi:MAG: tryptophan-rich sensory protein [Clostridiales bacterium]|nr:tryptophan-rich sensory protein [Clostridiales bacterium]
MNTTKKAWIIALLLVLTIAVNTLGAIGIINGLSQKEVSDMYPTLITPSPFTFSIWSVIYALLIVSVIMMIIKQKDSYYESAINEIFTLFWISCLLNIAWIIVFSYLLIEVSALLILLFAITLAMICTKLLKIHQHKRWLLPVSFGLYAGWLIIASVVNIASMLVKLQWNGFGIPAETWGVIVLIAAIILVALVIIKIRNAVLTLPIAWAFFGIFQNLKSPNGYNGAYGLLQTIAIIGAIILVILAVIQFIINRYAVLPAGEKVMEPQGDSKQ